MLKFGTLCSVLFFLTIVPEDENNTCLFIQTEEEVEEEEYVRIDDDESEYDRVEIPPVPSARPPEPPPLPEWNEPVSVPFANTGLPYVVDN